MAELDILPIKTIRHKRPAWLAEPLPAPPFCMTVFAPVKSGKSTLITNLVLSPKFYRHNDRSIWDKIILISPSAANDTSILPVAELEITTVFHRYDDNIINDIVDEQDVYQIDGKPTIAHDKPAILVILDDIAAEISRGSAVSKLAMRYRHFNISLIFTCQLYRSIPNTVRCNTSMYILFPTANHAERAKIVDEMNFVPDFAKYYDVAEHKKHSFITIDMQNMTIRERFGAILWQKS